MRASLILASAFTTLVAALPAWDQSPYHQSPFRIEQCSGVMPPFDMYLLNEENPNELTRVQSLFQVSQQTGGKGRQYLYVQYPPSKTGAFGCELHWSLPPWVTPMQLNAPQLDVKIAPVEMMPTWNKVVPLMHAGVFGTVSTQSSQSVVVNTAECSNENGGTGLAFVFKLAQFVEQSGIQAMYQFPIMGVPPTGFAGPYESYQC